MISASDLVSLMKSKNYKIFAGGAHDLNLIGLRSIPGLPNKFDDMLCVLTFEASVWKLRSFPCTTDPGTYWLKNPSKKAGTAILIPGQYTGAFKLGLHHQEYACLVQARTLPVWRDSDRDEVCDYNPGSEGSAESLQIHRANKVRKSVEVDKWSAGCQVIADPADFETFMDLCKKQVSSGSGGTFTYTLLEVPSSLL